MDIPHSLIVTQDQMNPISVDAHFQTKINLIYYLVINLIFGHQFNIFKFSIVQILLGLCEGVSERQNCNLMKGECLNEGHPISSRVASENMEGSSLDADEK